MSLKRRARRVSQHNRARAASAAALWLSAALLLSAAPQTALPDASRDPVPRLLRRTTDANAAPQESGVYRPGLSGLPDEASGTYALSQEPGEVIEIILNGEGSECRLQGYLTRLGDGDSDRGAPLTYFFQQTSVAPSQLHFSTRPVHGVRWSFTGHIDRGSAQQPSQKGFYFLVGTLMEHFSTGESQARRVSLPLLPQGPRSSP